MLKEKHNNDILDQRIKTMTAKFSLQKQDLQKKLTEKEERISDLEQRINQL